MSDNRQLVAVIEVSFAVIVWGASFIATKIAVGEILPVTVVWMRFAIGIVILGALTFARKQFALIAGKELAYFAVLGFLGIAFHQWLQSTGLLTAQATTTAWLVAVTPVFIAILGATVLKEKLRRWQIVGIALAAVGVLLVVSRGDFSTLAVGQFGTPGDMLVLISSANWAVFSIASRQGLQRHPAGRMMFYVMTLGWLITSVQFFAGVGFADIANLTQQGWIAVLFLGIVCSGLAYIFWYDALQIIPASQVGVFLYVEPIVAVIVAAAILNEPFGLVAMLGGATILVGVWLVNRKA